MKAKVEKQIELSIYFHICNKKYYAQKAVENIISQRWNKNEELVNRKSEKNWNQFSF